MCVGQESHATHGVHKMRKYAALMHEYEERTAAIVGAAKVGTLKQIMSLDHLKENEEVNRPAHYSCRDKVTKGRADKKLLHCL